MDTNRSSKASISSTWPSHSSTHPAFFTNPLLLARKVSRCSVISKWNEILRYFHDLFTRVLGLPKSPLTVSTTLCAKLVLIHFQSRHDANIILIKITVRSQKGRNEPTKLFSTMRLAMGPRQDDCLTPGTPHKIQSKPTMELW